MRMPKPPQLQLNPCCCAHFSESSVFCEKQAGEIKSGEYQVLCPEEHSLLCPQDHPCWRLGTLSHQGSLLPSPPSWHPVILTGFWVCSGLNENCSLIGLGIWMFSLWLGALFGKVWKVWPPWEMSLKEVFEILKSGCFVSSSLLLALGWWCDSQLPALMTMHLHHDGRLCTLGVLPAWTPSSVHCFWP